MNLKFFDLESVRLIPKGEVALSINGRSGQINFSIAAVRLLGLQHGDTIRLAQDKDRPADWYLQTQQEQGGFQLHGLPGRGLSITSKPLVHQLLASLTKRGEAQPTALLGVRIASEPVQPGLHAILTSTGKTRPLNP